MVDCRLIVMIKEITLFLAGGIAIGAAVLAVTASDSISLFAQNPQQETPLTTYRPAAPLPTPSPTQPDTVSPEELAAREDLRNRLKELHAQIYEEGITIQAIAGTAYPGIGFIASDDENTNIFVAWDGPAPTLETAVSITGILQPYDGSQMLPGQKGDLPEEATNLLTAQRRYLAATDVIAATGGEVR